MPIYKKLPGVTSPMEAGGQMMNVGALTVPRTAAEMQLMRYLPQPSEREQYSAISTILDAIKGGVQNMIPNFIKELPHNDNPEKRMMTWQRQQEAQNPALMQALLNRNK